MRGPLKGKLGRVATRVLPAAAMVFGLAGALAPHPAQAQLFGGWGGWGGGWGDSMGPGQIYQSIQERGFQVIPPLRRNGAVFVADVIDRRGRRERLIVAAADGEILQRFVLSAPPGPGYAPRNEFGQQRQEFDRPTERADRGDLVPPAPIPNVGPGTSDNVVVEPIRPRPVPKPVRPPRPRVVDRTPDEPVAPRHEVAPNHNVPRPKVKEPLAVPSESAKRPEQPPTNTASRPADTPEKPSVPAPAPAAPTTTTKLTDPLALPGGEPKKDEHPAEAPKASAAASGTPAHPRVVPGSVTGAPPAPVATPATPAPQAPAKSGDVPVAPLD